MRVEAVVAAAGGACAVAGVWLLASGLGLSPRASSGLALLTLAAELLALSLVRVRVPL